MKILTGTDIIEINRIQESIEKLGDNFKERIYTKKEIEFCESKKRAKYQHYAGRFAAKESIFKAISELLNDKYEISWKDAEILNDGNGKPRVILNNKNVQEKLQSIDISISHCKEYAIANTIVVCR